MAEAVHVQTIVSPQTPVKEVVPAPVVDNVCAVVLSNAAQQLIVGGGAATGAGEGALALHIQARNGQNRDVLGAHGGEGFVDAGHELVNINVGAHDIVAATVERNNVGAEVEGSRQLFIQDGAEQASADSKVCVLCLRVYCTEAFSNAVCPPAQAVGAAAVNVAHAFGEGVTDCHVAY